MTIFITHLLAFAFGAIAGLWWASNRRPGGAGADKTLQRLYRQHPEFFEELRSGLAREEFQDVRDFAILDSAGSTFVSEDVKFIYYEDELPNLKQIAAELEEHGYIDEITRGKTPLYRMRESFVAALASL